MNDWWNDPPEPDEGPECPSCPDGYGDYLYDGKDDDKEPVQVFACDNCGYQWSIPIEQDYGPEDLGPDPGDSDIARPDNKYCPHGEVWGECDACDHAGDLAYDAAREQRISGRR